MLDKNKNDLDQFFTKPTVAKKCWDYIIKSKKINLNDFDYILEPSAGGGAFFNLIYKYDSKKAIGIDLEPKNKLIKKQDFFKYKPIKNKKYIIVGNPPFGINSSLAVDFFYKASKFADIIAFVLPRTFRRVSLENRLPLNFIKILDKTLDYKPPSFNPEISAKCCFQIWKRVSGKEKERKINKRTIEHKDFIFLKFGDKDEFNQPTPPKGADFVFKAYGSNCGEIIDDKNKMKQLRPKSWHWIKSNIDVEKLKISIIDLESEIKKISENTVRQNSIGKADFIEVYNKKVK